MRAGLAEFAPAGGTPGGAAKRRRAFPLGGKSAKRRRWRMQRADFEEVSRFSAAKADGNRLTRRWARGGATGASTKRRMRGAEVTSAAEVGRCSAPLPAESHAPHQSFASLMTAVSLRLGHAAALTCHRHVIHSRGVASLPPRGKPSACGSLAEFARSAKRIGIVFATALPRQKLPEASPASPRAEQPSEARAMEREYLTEKRLRFS